MYDADLLSDGDLRALTALHAIAYATRTLDRFSEPGRYTLEVGGSGAPAWRPRAVGFFPPCVPQLHT